MSNRTNYEDLFGLILEHELGRGEYRAVYSHRFSPDIVIKVEIEKDWRSFANVKEHAIWWDWRDVPEVAQWLAPCIQLSPDGHFLAQRRAQPLPSDYALPDKLPAFLDDLKRSNFGLLEGRLVCVDYAFVNAQLKTKPVSVQWNA